MRFTKYHSVEEILSYPGMEDYIGIFYPGFLLEMFPQNMRKEPLALAEWFGETPKDTPPWGERFPVIAEQFLDAANLVLDLTVNRTRRCISIWDEKGGDWSPEAEQCGGKKQVFLLAPVLTEVTKRRPAVIICPGGGYETMCFRSEGTPLMHFMEAEGYRAFVLKYRVAPERYPKPQEDLALAIRYVRAHADEYGVDPEDVMLIGSSAGGHLCATEAAFHSTLSKLVEKELEVQAPKLARLYQGYSARPDKLVLCYPVVSFLKEQHEGSFQALTGGKEELREILSAERFVGKEFPPTFLWACKDDICVSPTNAERLAHVLEEKGVRHEFHLYSGGGHGCGLAFSREAYGWSRAMIDFFGSEGKS